MQLQEEKASLEYQLRMLTLQPPPAQLQQLSVPGSEDYIALRQQLAELEQRNIMLEIDLRREQNARRIVQEQMFFKQAAKSQNHRLGALVGSPLSAAPAVSNTPTRGSPMPSPTFGLFSSMLSLIHVTIRILNVRSALFHTVALDFCEKTGI